MFMAFECAITRENWEDFLEYYGRHEEESNKEREGGKGNGCKALYPSPRPAFIAVCGVHRRG